MDRVYTDLIILVMIWAFKYPSSSFVPVNIISRLEKLVLLAAETCVNQEAHQRECLTSKQTKTDPLCLISDTTSAFYPANFAISHFSGLIFLRYKHCRSFSCETINITDI